MRGLALEHAPLVRTHIHLEIHARASSHVYGVVHVHARRYVGSLESYTKSLQGGLRLVNKKAPGTTQPGGVSIFTG